MKEDFKDNEKVYTCELCGFSYKDKEWAEKCEDFCKKYKSCSLEIIEHAIK